MTLVGGCRVYNVKRHNTRPFTKVIQLHAARCDAALSIMWVNKQPIF